MVEGGILNGSWRERATGAGGVEGLSWDGRRIVTWDGQRIVTWETLGLSTIIAVSTTTTSLGHGESLAAGYPVTTAVQRHPYIGDTKRWMTGRRLADDDECEIPGEMGVHYIRRLQVDHLTSANSFSEQ